MWKAFQFLSPPLNETPIIVLGNQKSGTSVIAHLLADIGGLTKTIDIPPFWGKRGKAIVMGQESFAAAVTRAKAYFRADLIKEPMFTFFAGQIVEYFPQAKYVFIVRDPRDNIRSLLNSRKLPGHLQELTTDHLETLSDNSILFDQEVWGGENENYVGVLAYRWNKAVDNYRKHAAHAILVRYEDFMLDKLAYIQELACKLDIPAVNNISKRLDLAYQPRGNRNITWDVFFGVDNLQTIHRICGETMLELGYAIS
ncbi:MAG: sulfotransferase [Anaerolineales bacterium]|nr:sulfotransferase [Anaerolineales bacterium]